MKSIHASDNAVVLANILFWRVPVLTLRAPASGLFAANQTWVPARAARDH